MNNQVQDHELDWNSTIEKESNFVLLPEGDYDFTVTNLERKRYTPGPNSKLPACNQAVVDLTIRTAEGDAVIKHNLFLHTKTEGLLSAFFIGIGQKQKDQPLRMNWNTVVGSTGRAHIIINKYTRNNGDAGENNQVDHFIDQRDAQPAVPQQPTANPVPQQSAQPGQQMPAQPQYQQPVQNTTPFPQQPTAPNNFTPGAF